MGKVGDISITPPSHMDFGLLIFALEHQGGYPWPMVEPETHVGIL